MAKRNEGEVSPVPILWTYSANGKGKHPVKIRVTFQRKKKYYPVMNDRKEKIFLSVNEYNHTTTTPLKDLRNEPRKTRQAIDQEITKATDAITEATNSGRDPFSFDEFERKYLGEESGGKFLQFFRTHLKALEAKGQAGTVRVYSSVANSFEKFLRKDIDPGDITPEKLEHYEAHLRANGLSDTWIAICMRSIRAIYNRLAAKDEYLKMKYPFSRNDYDEKYKIPVGSGQKGQTLTKEELLAFIDGEAPGEQTKENPYYKAKLLLLFSFYAQGMNFKDVANLRYSNIMGNSIVFERAKTIRMRREATEIRIPITEELSTILLEIGNADKRKTSFIFEVFDPSTTYSAKERDRKSLQFVKTTNKWLKKYCEANTLPVVTTYSARHSFASLSKVELPLAQISAMLGHSRIETTQRYLGRFEDENNREGLMKVFGSLKKKTA